MPGKLSIFETFKLFCAPQIIKDNRLNPVHLALATRGYWVESQILHIPGGAGFFSSGPPRLQVHQGSLFVLMIINLVIAILWTSFAVFVLMQRVDTNRPPIWRFVAFNVAICVAILAVFWVMAAHYDKHRAPDYDWGDWKLRKD